MPHALLIVDDDPLFLDRCKLLFNDSPYELHCIQSPLKALAQIKDGLAPIVAVVGQDMAEVTGPQFLVQLKEMQPQCQSIMVAGGCDRGLITQAINQGGLFRYYPKDVADEVLKRGVVDAIAHYVSRKQSIDIAKRVVEANEKLEDMTSGLQDQVKSDTKKLQQSLDENVQLTRTLKRTVRELEGRDRVLRHLLTIHKLEDTLQTILEVIEDVLAINRGVIYVADEKGQLAPRCTLPRDSSELSKPSKLAEQALVSGQMEVDCESDSQQSATAVPICKGDTVLGVIEVVWDKTDTKSKCGDPEFLEDCQTIYIFTIHAAIAISDHNISNDKSGWSKTIDDVLMDFMD